MARVDNLTNFLNDTADAIREKRKTGAPIPASEFDAEIRKIETGGGGEGEIKLFETIDEMNANPGENEDLAIVYASAIGNMQSDSIIQIVQFPDKVILPEQVIDYIDISMRSVDQSKWADMWGNIGPEGMNISFYGENDNFDIRYTSTDGKTYTRTDTKGNPVDFGTEMHCPYPWYWNDLIGYFFQTISIRFDGLFQFGDNKKDCFRVFTPTTSFLNTVSGTIDITSSTEIVASQTLSKLLSGDQPNMYIVIDRVVSETIGNATYLKILDFTIIAQRGMSGAMGMHVDGRMRFPSMGGYPVTKEIYIDNVLVSIEEMPFTIEGTDNYTIESVIGKRGFVASHSGTDNLSVIGKGNIKTNWKDSFSWTGWGNAPNQLGVAEKDILPNVSAYGKNGIVTGDGSIYDNLDMGNDKLLGNINYILALYKLSDVKEIPILNYQYQSNVGADGVNMYTLKDVSGEPLDNTFFAQHVIQSSKINKEDLRTKLGMSDPPSTNNTEIYYITDELVFVTTTSPWSSVGGKRFVFINIVTGEILNFATISMSNAMNDGDLHYVVKDNYVYIGQELGGASGSSRTKVFNVIRYNILDNTYKVLSSPVQTIGTTSNGQMSCNKLSIVDMDTVYVLTDSASGANRLINASLFNFKDNTITMNKLTNASLTTALTTITCFIGVPYVDNGILYTIIVLQNKSYLVKLTDTLVVTDITSLLGTTPSQGYTFLLKVNDGFILAIANTYNWYKIPATFNTVQSLGQRGPSDIGSNVIGVPVLYENSTDMVFGTNLIIDRVNKINAALSKKVPAGILGISYSADGNYINTYDSRQYCSQYGYAGMYTKWDMDDVILSTLKYSHKVLIPWDGSLPLLIRGGESVSEKDKWFAIIDAPSGPISQDEYVTAIDTAKNILGGVE